MGNIYPQILMFHDLPIPMDPVVPLVGFTVSRGCELQPIIHCQVPEGCMEFTGPGGPRQGETKAKIW